MQCKTCNYPDSHVVDTKKDNRNPDTIYRRRECIKCGSRFNTQENSKENIKRSTYKTIMPNRVLPK